VIAVPDGGGSWFGKLMQLVIGVVIVSMLLGALQSALYQVMPSLVVLAVLIGAGWLVWRIVHSRRDRW
jgi:hypothetical protein